MNAGEGIYSIADYGAVQGDPLAAAANSDAIDAALAALVAALPQRDAVGNPLASGGVLYVPPGVWYVERTVTLRRTITLQGAGGAGFASPSQLWFTKPVVGVHVMGTFDWTTQPDEAPHSVIRDLRLRATVEPTNPDAHGYLLESRCSLQNFGVWGFGGNGVHALSGEMFPNVNNLYLAYGHLYYNRNGIYLKATNANAGTFIALECSYNREYGVYDDSFLGNVHVGHHAAYNEGGAYWCNSNAPSQWLNCYSEMDQKPSLFGQFCTVVGGSHGAGVEGLCSFIRAGMLPQMGIGFHVHPSIICRDDRLPRPYEGRFGSGPSNMQGILSFKADEEEGAHDLVYNNAAGEYDGAGSGWWDMIYANTSDFQSFSVAGTQAKDYWGMPAGQRDVASRCPAGSMKVPHLFFRQKDGQAMPKVSFAAAPPTTPAEWGDVVFNARPAAGQPAFWQCQEDGTWVAR